MNIVGIDYSVNSPGIVKFTVNDSLEIININYLGFSTSKRTCDLDPANIYHYKDFDNSFEKVYWFRDHCLNFMNLSSADYCAIEDYAFGASGRVFGIAESTFAMKEKLYDNGAHLRTYPPSAIKKFSTGLGNADKNKMLDAFNQSEHAKIFEHLPKNNPKEDLVDAFFVAQMLLTELKLRRGLITLGDLTKKQSEVFSQTSKSNPETILNRKFIQKQLDSI